MDIYYYVNTKGKHHARNISDIEDDVSPPLFINLFEGEIVEGDDLDVRPLPVAFGIQQIALGNSF